VSIPVYAVIDTETGGLNELKNPLIQVSVILCDKDLNELEAYAHRIIPNPMYVIEPKAAEINGYNEELWLRTGLTHDRADQSWAQFIKQWFGHRKPVGVAHNAQFDEKFFAHHMPRTSELFFHPWLCTMTVMKRWKANMLEKLKAEGCKDQAKIAKYKGSNKLRDLVDLCGHKPLTAHDALEDTYSCLAGLRWLKQQNVVMTA
jgi:oligoribonuclease (3'-5' exoribonuclease)